MRRWLKVDKKYASMKVVNDKCLLLCVHFISANKVRRKRYKTLKFLSLACDSIKERQKEQSIFIIAIIMTVLNS